MRLCTKGQLTPKKAKLQRAYKENKTQKCKQKTTNVAQL